MVVIGELEDTVGVFLHPLLEGDEDRGDRVSGEDGGKVAGGIKPEEELGGMEGEGMFLKECTVGGIVGGGGLGCVGGGALREGGFMGGPELFHVEEWKRV